MVNPDHICVVDSDGITSPNILRVNVCDPDVPTEVSGYQGFGKDHELDDNVLSTRHNAESLALDDTSL